MAMNNNELLAIVSFIERERGVDREIVLVAIEQALQQAARRNPGVTNDLRVAIDRKTLSLHVYDTMVVSNEETGTGFISLARAQRLQPGIAEGETIEIEMPASKLGRIAAQTSRQMIMQKIREAERSNTFREFKGRIGEIVSGTVTAVNRRDLYVMVGKTEMLLPGKERIPTEEYGVGDLVRAIVHSVKPESTGPAVTLSRASSEFVRTLFRLEVSEIADGVVEIMGVARDPGYRSKVAVRTRDEKVDPVGACVGLRGARVRNIVRELNGEKKTPVVLHRAILGSLDRFMAYILEETKGNLPTWLAPVQVRVMPVKTDNEDLMAYAHKVVDALDAIDVRVELDDRAEKLGYRMREGQVQKVPYLLVIGFNEAENGTVSYRLHGEADTTVLPLDEFVQKIDTEIKTMAHK